MKSMVAQSVLIEESDDEVLDMLLDEAIPTETGFPDRVMSVTDTIAQQAVYPETHPVPPPNNNENDGEAVIHGNSRCDPVESRFGIPVDVTGASRSFNTISRFHFIISNRWIRNATSKKDGLEMLPVKKAYGDQHPFYWIPPSKHIKMQLATPHVAEQLNRYPKLTENKIQGMCKGRKWRVCNQFQTSSATVNGQTVFVGDVVGFYGRDNSKAYGQIMDMNLTFYVINLSGDYLVILEDLDVLKINEIDEICEISLAYKDVNGVIYSLTPEVCTMLDSETLGKVIAEDLLELETGMVMYDSFTQAEIFVQCPILCVLCDNPKASEICHHLGSTAQHFCRNCDATSGNAFQLGQPRTDIAVKSTGARINNC
ncbi:Hypothetical predicted protein, partial [Paramuricea clavata]